MIKGKTEQETLEITMEVLGVSEDRAREILAIEADESAGDEIELSAE